MNIDRDQQIAKERLPQWLRTRAPDWLKRIINNLYWMQYDITDFASEMFGYMPSHSARNLCYRHLLKINIGRQTSIHRRCRFYYPTGIRIGNNTVVNRDVLLDGRMGVLIGDSVSISEGCMILTLEHDPNSASFENRGGEVILGNRVFLGTRVLILPGVTIGNGAYVAAGAVVSKDVSPYEIVAGVPARVIGRRNQDLEYSLNYRKFLG